MLVPRSGLDAGSTPLQIEPEGGGVLLQIGLLEVLPVGKEQAVHLPEFTLRRNPILRLPPRFPSRPRVAHRRLKHHVILRPRHIAQVLKKNDLPIRAPRAEIEKDFISIIENRLHIVPPELALAPAPPFPMETLLS